MTSNVETNGKSCSSDIDLDLRKFVASRILSNNTNRKTIAVVGKFPNISETNEAIVILEKKAFTKENIFGEIKKDEKHEGQETTTKEDLCVFNFVKNLKKDFVNDIYGNFTLALESNVNLVKTTIVYPATELHIKKYSGLNLSIFQETPELFRSITEPYLEKRQLALDWVFNILDHKQESERIVFEDPDDSTGFILLPDLKWDGKTKETLYLIAICRRKGIRSLRDLTAEHLPLLKNIRSASIETISKIYGISRSHLRIYVHYQPSFYHFHVHFTYLKHEAPGIHCERSHLLDTVISNIEIVPDYYQKAVLSFTVRDTDELYEKYNNELNEEESIEPCTKKLRTE